MTTRSTLFHGPYPILDQATLTRSGLDPTEVATFLATLPIPLVQLRGKGPGGEFFTFCTQWMNALRQQAPRVRVIVNDRVDIALALDADGVHVGQGDLPVSVCRQLLGKKRLVGLSTHDLAELDGAEGADYVGFGPIYATTTKSDAEPVRGVTALAGACDHTSLPVVAIGGIRVENLPAIQSAGAAMAAMIGALWQDDWRANLRQAVTAWPHPSA